MKLLREYIRELIKEEAESAVPKNQREMMAVGDPRREAVQQEILIPPPPSESERVQELDQIQRQYNNRFNEETDQDLLNHVTKTFDTVLVSSGKESHYSLINDLKFEILPIIDFHKAYFNIERPYVLASRQGIDFKSDFLKSAQTPSYPSGHTAQAYYIADKLSRMYPEMRSKLLDTANMISQARIDRGVHFPSDIKGGILLAKKILEKRQ